MNLQNHACMNFKFTNYRWQGTNALSSVDVKLNVTILSHSKIGNSTHIILFHENYIGFLTQRKLEDFCLLPGCVGLQYIFWKIGFCDSNYHSSILIKILMSVCLCVPNERCCNMTSQND